jgi:hypothetical protein
VQKIFKTLLPKQRNVMDSFTVSSNDTRTLIVATQDLPPAGLLGLLANKKYTYVSRMRSRAIPRAITESVLSFDGAFEVTDAPASPLNAPENFEAVTQLLEYNAFNLSITEIRRNLKNIEEEAQESEEERQIFEKF